MDPRFINAKLAFTASQEFAAGDGVVLVRCPAASAAFAGAFLDVEVLGSGAGGGTVELRENPTVTGDGTPVTLHNRNRLTPLNPTTLVAFHTPTITPATGTVIQLSRYALNFKYCSGPWFLNPGEEYAITVADVINAALVVNLNLKVVPDLQWLLYTK